MQHAPSVRDKSLEFFVFFETACVQHSDSTWTAKNKGVEWDALMNRILSHTTTSALFFTLSLSLPGDMLQSALEEAICFKISSLRPCKKPPVWNCSYGCYRRLCVLPQLSPSQYEQSRELRRLHGRENSTCDCYHSDIRLCVPIPLLGWAPVCCSAPTFSLAGLPSQIPESSQLPEPQHVKKATTWQLKHILRMQRPDSTPSTLLNSRVSLRRFPSLGPMARLP